MVKGGWTRQWEEGQSEGRDGCYSPNSRKTFSVSVEIIPCLETDVQSKSKEKPGTRIRKTSPNWRALFWRNRARDVSVPPEVMTYCKAIVVKTQTHTRKRLCDYFKRLQFTNDTPQKRGEKEPKNRYLKLRDPIKDKGSGFTENLYRQGWKRPCRLDTRVTNVNFTKDENHSGQ